MPLPLGQLGDLGKMFEGMKEKPELDKTKEALKALKKDVEEGKPIDIDRNMASVRKLFDIDMEELDIKDPEKQEEYWQKVRLEIETMLLQLTPEFKEFDAFSTKLENMAGLRKIIDSKNPKEKLKGKIDEIKEKYSKFSWGFGFLASWLTSMADDWKKGNDNKDTFFGKKVREIAGWFGGKKEAEGGKKDKKKKGAPAATAAAGQTEAAKEQPKQNLDKLKKPELHEIAVKYARKFQIDLKTLESDLDALKESGLKKVEIDSLIDTGLSKEGRFRKIGEAVQSFHKPFVFRLADIRLQKESDFSNEKIAQIETAIKTEIKTDKDSLRKFLDGVLKDPSKITAAIELNKKSVNS